jgi:hypothetical protein
MLPSGKVIAQLTARHRAVEFKRFRIAGRKPHYAKRVSDDVARAPGPAPTGAVRHHPVQDALATVPLVPVAH